MEAADGGLWDWHVQTRQVIYNRKYADMLGIPVEETTEHIALWKRMVHPDDLPEVLEKTTQLLQGHIPQYEVEYRLQDRSGNWKWIHARGMVVERDDAGRAVRTAGITLDITDRKRTEETLRTTHDALQAFFDATSDVFALIDRDMRFLLTNRYLSSRFGLEPSDLVGKSLFDILPRDLASSRQQKVEEVFEKGVPVQFEDCRNGDCFDNNLYPVRDSSGEVYAVATVARNITDRKRADELLRHAEKRYRRLFEDAPFMYVISRNERGVPVISDCNELFLHSLGYAREEVLGKSLADFYSAESAARLFEGGGYTRALAGGFFMGERELLRKDGSLIPTLLYTATETDPSGKVTGVRAMFADISKLKETESAQRETERRYTGVFENAAVGIDVVDANGRIIEANPSLALMLGYRQDELLNLTFLDATHPEDVEDSENRYDKMLRGEIDSYRFEKRYIRKDGQAIWVDVSVSPVRGSAGAPVGGIAVMTDITRRKDAEAERERLVSAIEQAVEAAIITDVAGDIQYVNPAFEKITGYTSEEAVGRNPRMLKSGEHDRGFYREMWKTITRGKVWSGHLVNRRKDGSLYHEEATISPLKDPSGKIVNFVSSEARHHGELGAFQAVGPGPEDGGCRYARGRRCPRFQQHLAGGARIFRDDSFRRRLVPGPQGRRTEDL